MRNTRGELRVQCIRVVTLGADQFVITGFERAEACDVESLTVLHRALKRKSDGHPHETQ
jgi:hypothetical protein